MEEKKEEKKEEKRDWKMIIGMTLFILIFAVIGGSFWKMVGKEAEKVKEEEARAEAEAITAIYLETGEYLKKPLFADVANEMFFTAEIPGEGIYNKKEKLIEGDVLEIGDVVKIYGNGIITRSDPGQYAEVIKMQRVRRADLEETQKYLDLAEERYCTEDEREERQ